MAKYSCFICPGRREEEHCITDPCPTCGRPYDFPLTQAPATIGPYQVEKALDRGFYSAAYMVKVGRLGEPRVLKVVSDEVYQHFKKDFEQECRDHHAIAANSPHFARIIDYDLNVPVVFGDARIVCHIAEIDYIQGETLRNYLSCNDRIPAATVAQIAIDLFSILSALAARKHYHNDLHDGNLIIQHLADDARRADAEDPFTRVVAIDLNSASDTSRSDAEALRHGDIHWVAQHLTDLVDRLLVDPDATDDIDFRLACVLRERIHLLSPGVLNQRPPTFDECIDDIRTALREQKSPWNQILELRRFNDTYNAQTLAPWYVPYLLEDPEGKWLSSIAASGPLVITGMRGCGKTMLLRGLQFHARAVNVNEPRDAKAIIDSLRKDKYVGLYASCTRLLDTLGRPTDDIHEPFARLFLAYSVEALRALRHLREIDSTIVLAGAYREIARVVASIVEGASDVQDVGSEYAFERKLVNMIISLDRGGTDYSLPGHPSTAFPLLADAITKCSTVWHGATVFFLLDDVSTRYLKLNSVQSLMSALIFPSPNCAFKLTTEAQTLAMLLYSPGMTERARAGRDYEFFDLGAEVSTLARGPKGKQFFGSILKRRARYFASGYKANIEPHIILGDTSMESIALQIARTQPTSQERKRLYWGLTALMRVCVGDIGDVISIYEMILRKGTPGKYPIDSQKQSECFQDFCSRRLYDLNRRDSDMKDYAKGFAEASHHLLKQSFSETKTAKRSAERSKSSPVRIRQYLKVYVRITTGDSEQQFARLRELIDAGVFVLDGGSYRTKTRDADPIQQFKLTYRKLFGLASHIGLAERDRFELSGKDLEEWLAYPSRSKEILLRNLSTTDDTDDELAAEVIDDLPSKDNEKVAGAGITSGHDLPPVVEQDGIRDRSEQLDLWHQDVASMPMNNSIDGQGAVLCVPLHPVIRLLTPAEVQSIAIRNLIIGLGFEDRTEESVRRLVDISNAESATCIRYVEPGKASEILATLNRHGISCSPLAYETLLNNDVVLPYGLVAVDITGLAKPVIFRTIRATLKRDRRVIICHTEAQQYYPLDGDIQAALEAESSRDYTALLEKLANILTGEDGPYSVDPLLNTKVDETRRRALLGFASPKHERLLTLLDARSYDIIDVVAQGSETFRGEVARISADFIARNYSGTSVTEYRSDDLQGVLQFIAERFRKLYVEGGFNYELGLTGSKLQAVACAIASSYLRISQCWYVRPNSFDPGRFTSGVGDTSFYEICLPSDE